MQRLLVANNERGGGNGDAINTLHSNERRGDSNRPYPAACFHLGAIASPAMMAALVGDDIQ
jgi:hypothetical protein